MKQLRFLLLLLAIIVAQGVRAQEECQHNLIHHEATYDCFYGGSIEYWECQNCEGIFADAECKEKLEDYFKEPTYSHNFNFSDGDGNWHCQNCTQVVHGLLSNGDNYISSEGFNDGFDWGNYYLATSYNIYRYVAPNDERFILHNVSVSPKVVEAAIFNSDWEYVTSVELKNGSSSLECDVIEGQELFIGIRARYANTPLEYEHFYIGFRCQHESTTYVNHVEATCEHAGVMAHRICNNCGKKLDLSDPDGTYDDSHFIFARLPHEFNNGKCKNCGYEVPTLTLTKNGNQYTFAGTVHYDLNSSVYEQGSGGHYANASIFRVNLPVHGNVSLKAYAARNEGRFDAYPPYLYLYNDYGSYGQNMGYEPMECEELIPGHSDYYIVVKNAEVTDALLEITLSAHNEEVIYESSEPTCTTDGKRGLYHCEQCSTHDTSGWNYPEYYVSEDGYRYGNTPDESDFIIPAFGHNFDLTTGICQNDGCEELIRTLTEGLNEAVDCSNNNMYFFVPEKDGELSVYTSTDNEYVINFRVMNEYGKEIHSDRQKAPSRGGANTLEFNRVSVEKGKKYILSLNSTIYGVDEVDVYIEVKEDVILSDTQDNEVSFPEGENQVTAFKYTATQTKCLNVVVETNATINDYIIMPWSEWMPSDNDDKPMSAPRKVSGQEEVEPLMTKNVIAGTTYAIAFLTTADSNEDATITLSYTDIVYPAIEEGETTIDIAAVNGNRDENPEHYNIFKFVAPKTGVARFYTYGSEDTYGVLFSDSFERLTYNDDNDTDSNFDFTWSVEKGETYYLGVRSWGGYSIGEYPLFIEIEGIPEFEGTLEFATVDGDGKVTENEFVETVMKYFPTENDFSMVFVANDGVIYKRATTNNKWGTVVLPYELKSNDKVAYYELTAADVPSGKLEFTKVETVAPNTPTVYRIISGNQFDASVDGPVTVELPEDLGDFDLYVETKVDGWFMDGWYYEDVIDTQDENGYCVEQEASIMYISGDKFWHAEGSVKVKPYRAIFEIYGVDWYASTTSNAMSISFVDDDNITTTINSIIEENGEFTDIEAIYDLNGQRKNSIQRGVNIIRTADGKTRKFIKK